MSGTNESLLEQLQMIETLEIECLADSLSILRSECGGDAEDQVARWNWRSISGKFEAQSERVTSGG